jgi:hypothetical protein
MSLVRMCRHVSYVIAHANHYTPCLGKAGQYTVHNAPPSPLQSAYQFTWDMAPTNHDVRSITWAVISIECKILQVPDLIVLD